MRFGIDSWKVPFLSFFLEKNPSNDSSGQFSIKTKISHPNDSTPRIENCPVTISDEFCAQGAPSFNTGKVRPQKCNLICQL